MWRSEPKTSVHSSRGRVVVTRIELRSSTPLAGIPEVWDSAKGSAIGFSSHPFSYGEWGFTAMAGNRAVSSHGRRVGLTRAGVPGSAIMPQGRWYSSAMVARHTRGDAARWLERGV